MSDKIYFEVISALGKKIRVTKNYWNKIIETKHSLMKGKEALVKETLKKSAQIRISNKDASVYLYYKKINGDYSCVVAKHLNGEGFIITTYITDRIKAGKEYEAN
mgnify:CR=1 FL=1